MLGATLELQPYASLFQRAKARAERAGQCFRAYRRRGGEKRSPLPDFYIGAHAAAVELSLLTRDRAQYRTYFPRIRLVAP